MKTTTVALCSKRKRKKLSQNGGRSLHLSCPPSLSVIANPIFRQYFYLSSSFSANQIGEIFWGIVKI
ncbi:hypothetical protein RchiOBHm_Chr7g0214591 [Rosa chinensis]|uniref:Uncharacterized protein n=1 Tax=Rosa chinensis TaxID=74649 RepID=A0A2P6PB91_ROSCH|nr:hypothetical protein RchiOBHm_Chr7g0214591 [Rosa chinensis]